ncbi:MAG: hypothetical protein GEU79_07835, partial [Acidimicrobiia bacterium]|nr:hypothetical protein [Acidimicrobiia bacterium]
MARIRLQLSLLLVVVSLVVSGCGMSEGEASDFTYQGLPVMDLGPSLGQFETRFQDLVKDDRGLLTDGSGCFLSTLSGAATEEVVCGPVVFPGGSLDRVWVRYPAAYEPVNAEGFGGEDVVGHRLTPTEDPPTVGTALGPSEKLGSVDGTIEDPDTLGTLTSVPSYETMGRSFSETLSESPAPMESMNASVAFPRTSIRLTATGSAEGYRLDGEPRVAPDGAEFLFVQLEASGNPGSLVSRIEMADQEPRTF